MYQFSSLKKVNDSDISEANVAKIKYFGLYKMNMGISKDIIIYLKNIETKQEFRPFVRSKDGMSVIKVPQGEYYLSKLIIRDSRYDKCLCKNDETEKYIYGFSDRDCNEINFSGFVGTPFNGGLLLGDKYLEIQNSVINNFEVKNGEVFIADSLFIKGTMESIFSDLPNLVIMQSKSKKLHNEVSFFKFDLTEINRNYKKKILNNRIFRRTEILLKII